MVVTADAVLQAANTLMQGLETPSLFPGIATDAREAAIGVIWRLRDSLAAETRAQSHVQPAHADILPAGAWATLDEHNGLVRRTYSLEAEDILIQRMFDAFIGKASERKGTYLDLGAFHPVWDSNTYRFYRMGWRGICIEPNPAPLEEFRTLRPEDELWNFGVSPEGAGTLTYHRFSQAGLNGFYGNDILDLHIGNGQEYLGATEIDCISVEEFMQRLKGRSIDFLDIDIETLDAAILRKWDWSISRPKLICAEVHRFLLKDIMDAEISLILAEADYSPMCRGWQSVIYVDNDILRAFAPHMTILKTSHTGEQVLATAEAP